ncbi:MAG: CRISPR-associated protein Cas5 [Finegoldia magna]|uniref:CRISPR-associated protein Cas5 n=1 Tax=Finegoldia magna TaxID=1260 RepID=UPI0029007196|nr:CRISPR-associated protein Cas5 [Finegoldia magna]MDU1009825.1 CRISPR-associated protein Cas5 [Finegoldia magna]MDU1086688.1 CRISPR-associated protein Cas5 [Finegoldia magna]
MKIIRIKIKQAQASYTREETVDNHTTYPLPPFSTIIGALHNACGYTSYRPMDISVQGKYGSMQREYYTNIGLLNNREEDRNFLVYLKNPHLLSKGFIQIGEGLKSQGNSFINRKTVRIDDEEYYSKYVDLMKKKKELDEENKNVVKPKIKELKDKEKEFKTEQKKYDKNSEEYEDLKNKIEDIKKQYKLIDSEFKDKYKREYDDLQKHFKTLVKKPSMQEVLYDVELVIHIRTEDDTANDILENIQNFVSLGRSEDFIELIEAKETEIIEADDDVDLKNDYKIYAKLSEISRNGNYGSFIFTDGNNKKEAKGTVYYISKDYVIENNRRVFNKIPCLYSSNLGIDEDSNGFVDSEGYIVSLN